MCVIQTVVIAIVQFLCFIVAILYVMFVCCFFLSKQTKQTKQTQPDALGEREDSLYRLYTYSVCYIILYMCYLHYIYIHTVI